MTGYLNAATELVQYVPDRYKAVNTEANNTITPMSTSANSVTFQLDMAAVARNKIAFNFKKGSEWLQFSVPDNSISLIQNVTTEMGQGGACFIFNSTTPVIAVAITPTSSSIVTGGSVTFFAAVTGTTNTSVTWSVIETAGGSITTSGVYTAPATTGTFNIKAVSNVDATKFAVASVTVTAVPINAYDISGTITANGIGLSGVTFAVNSGGISPITDANGAYSFSAIPNGTYNITPNKAGYTFSPASITVSVNGSDVTGKNFTASATVVPPNTYNISGTITANGIGLSGVTFAVNSGPISPTTDSSGAYSFSAVPNGTYNITPSKAGYTFSPASLIVSVNGSDVTGKNFTASSTTVIAAGILLNMADFATYPSNAYSWTTLNLLPQWNQYWKGNDNLLAGRYSKVKTTGYHSGCVINQSWISEYDILAKTIDPSAAWSNTYYLKNQSGTPISFDGVGALYYVDITNAAARAYMVKVAKGVMRAYNSLVGHPLSGIFLDHVEWKPRTNAQAVISDAVYRARMLDFFSELRAAIVSENSIAELGGNAGAVHDHHDYTLLDKLDTVLAENALGILFGDSTTDLQNFLQHYLNQPKRPVLVIGIDGDNNGCPSQAKWSAANILATSYSTMVLISADYGPSNHGTLDCFRSEYLIR